MIWCDRTPRDGSKESFEGSGATRVSSKAKRESTG